MVDRMIAQELTTAAYDTGDSGKRHLAMTSKGVIWFGMRHNGNLRLYAGQTMVDPTFQAADSAIANGVLTCAGEWSMFIDELDNIHIVYAKYAGANGDGRTDKASIMYRHGVLSASHTGITWSVEVAVTGYDFWHSPDVVAHSLNGQIYAHVLTSYNWAGDNRVIIHYWRCRTNSGDSVNHVVETSVFIHDVSGSMTQVSKPSIELRHNGDGKTPQLVGGSPTPDVFCSYEMNGVLWYTRIRWTGATWAQAEQFNIAGLGGVYGGSYGGLYQHHGWHRCLYSALDSKVCVIGWLRTYPSAGIQSLVMYEFAPGASTVLLTSALMTGWTGAANQPAAISGAAAMDPDGSIEVLGSGYGANWWDQLSRVKVRRPLSGAARSLTTHEVVSTGGAADGWRVDLLSYPPGGEHHALFRHGNTWMYYWRNNRGCPYVALSQRLNLTPTPAFEGSLGAWVEDGTFPGTVSLGTGGTKGDGVLRLNGPSYVGAADPTALTVTPGKTYTLSAYARIIGSVTNFRVSDAVSMTVYNKATGTNLPGVSIAWPRTDFTGPWVRRWVTFTVPAGVTSVALRAYAGDAMPDGNTYAGLDGILLEEGSIRDYFDGSTAATANAWHTWLGAAHASQSTEWGIDPAAPVAVMRRPKFRLRLDGALVPVAARVPMNLPSGPSWAQLPAGMTWDAIAADTSWDEL